ncbi:hypothetical protein DEI97_013445 [Curtobacterium sp. MCLR17_032]|uniref:hypothetical protein n=1 Tax=Curtobacterium sp. MCLR17_032 TaxID=2175650 RepID=UPI000DA873F1|nr:hypothetical protein [Curtobacterium sp. MCLR17_032]WIE60745.1 hypothetical protein DEI97_013445 [Curtobacterium sp. MCLR17_032]
MRDTFIASAGEHYEEFERWVQAHDDEVRAPMQPPTREQIAEALWESARQEGDEPVWTWQYLTERADRGEGDYAEIRAEYHRSADAVLARFPQPTPSAEPFSYPDVWNAAIDRAQEELVRQDQFSERTLRILDEQRIPSAQQPVPAEPVSIAEPGDDPWVTTTEYAYGALDAPDVIVSTGEDIDDLGSARYNAEEFWVDVLQRTVKRGPWQVVTAEADPSTIRDVTPPPATPGEGDRG